MEENQKKTTNEKFKELLVNTGVLQKDLAKHLTSFQTMLSNKLNDTSNSEEKVKISNEIEYLSFLKFLLLDEYNYGAFEQYSKALSNVFYETDIAPILEEYNIRLEKIDPIFEHISNVNIDDVEMFNDAYKGNILREIAYAKYVEHDKEVSRRRCEMFKMQYQLFLESQRCEKNFNVRTECMDFHTNFDD